MTPDDGLDRLLDRSIVLGYSALGPLLRRGSWPAEPAPDALTGTRAVVTGASGGLGEATALGLARLGAAVHLVGRSLDRLDAAAQRIGRTLRSEGHPSRLHTEVCDVSDLDDVRRFAEELLAHQGVRETGLDVVVHNAGVMPAERTESAQGHELTVATHVLGPVLMTELLRPALRRSPRGARVVLVSSGGMYTQPLPLTDPDFRRGRYRGATAYARSKRMQVELLQPLAHRWSREAVVVGMHPGWADTPGVASSLPAFRLLTRPILRDPTSGADTVVWLSGSRPAPATGTFWHDRRQRPTSYREATRPTPGQVHALFDWVRQNIAIPPSGDGAGG